MNEDEKWAYIQETLLRTMCTDDSEFKAATLRHNVGISEEARALHAQAMVLDCCVSGLENDNWLTAASGLTALCVTVPDVDNPNSGAAIKNLANLHWAVHRCPESLALINTAQDVMAAKRAKKTGAIASSHHVDFMLHRDLVSAAEVFSAAGFRVARIAGSTRSFVADNVQTGTNAGITLQGKEFLIALKENGITVDLTGASEKSFYGALSVLRKPVVCSSSGIAALYPHPYNLNDKQLRAMAAAGGVVCLSADPRLNWNGRDLPTIDRYIDALEYVVQTAGIDAVGIGTGLCGQPGGRERRGVLHMLDDKAGLGLPYLAMFDAGWGVECTSLMGLSSIANLPNLTDHLLKRGFSHQHIRKILGENLLRVFKETWPQ